MLGLLLTLFISLFSICPIVNSVDQNENNEISIIDNSTQNKYFGVLDEYGIQFYMTAADLYNGQFMKYFISHAPTSSMIGFQYYSEVDYYMDLNSTFYNIQNWHVGNTALANVDLLRIQKYRVDYHTYDGEEFYEMYYFFNFIDSNNGSPVNYLQFVYVFYVPLLDYYTHDLGINCNYVDCTLNNLGVNNMGQYVYFEDSNSGPTPFYTYGYQPYISGGMTGSYNEGYNNGFDNGYQGGYIDGRNYGYQKGYNQALDDTAETTGTAVTIFNGIFEIGLLPVNVFLTILNFEVFGINISGLVSGLLTVAIIVIILRFLLGGKNDK